MGDSKETAFQTQQNWPTYEHTGIVAVCTGPALDQSGLSSSAETRNFPGKIDMGSHS